MEGVGVCGGGGKMKVSQGQEKWRGKGRVSGQDIREEDRGGQSQRRGWRKEVR